MGWNHSSYFSLSACSLIIVSTRVSLQNVCDVGKLEMSIIKGKPSSNEDQKNSFFYDYLVLAQFGRLKKM